MFKKSLRILFLMVLSLCGASGANAMLPNDTSMPSMDANALEKQLTGPNPPFVLDVREPAEYNAGHVPGAVLIPLGSLPDHLSEVPKDRPVVVMCRSGHRSGRATAFLIDQGYKNITNLTGGMNAWSAKCEKSKTAC